MSFQERLGSQDAVQLLTLASGLALATSAGQPLWSYNLPLMLFGIIAHELPSSHQPLRQFISLTTFSAIFDLFNLFSASFGFTFLIALVLLVLKAPIVATCSGVLRERGGEVGIGFGGFAGLPHLGGGGGQGNWNLPSMPSMPGAFGGSQPSQQPSSQANPHGGNPPPPPPQFPSSGGFRLGGEEEGQGGAPSQAPQPGRNGYSSIA